MIVTVVVTGEKYRSEIVSEIVQKVQKDSPSNGSDEVERVSI